jgi:hypothetical protein
MKQKSNQLSLRYTSYNNNDDFDDPEKWVVVPTIVILVSKAILVARKSIHHPKVEVKQLLASSISRHHVPRINIYAHRNSWYVSDYRVHHTRHVYVIFISVQEVGYYPAGPTPLVFHFFQLAEKVHY